MKESPKEKKAKNKASKTKQSKTNKQTKKKREKVQHDKASILWLGKWPILMEEKSEKGHTQNKTQSKINKDITKIHNNK